MTNPFEPPSGEQPNPGPPPPPGQPQYGQPMPQYGQPQYGQQPPYGQPPYGGPPPYGQAPPYGAYPAAMRNGLGTAGLVLGIIGVVAGATIFLFPIAFILGVLAVIFGLIGRGRAKRGEASNGSKATWGFGLGVASLVLSVIGLIVVHTVFRNTVRCIQRSTTQEQQQACFNDNSP